jgi:thiol-disulfide isomerase/thioredoxin
MLSLTMVPDPVPPEARSVVMLFVMKGCGHCHEYWPRFKRIASKYQNYVPIYVFDAEDPRYEIYADRYGVTGMPTTIVAKKPTGFKKWEGSVDNQTIEHAFQLALSAMQYGG